MDKINENISPVQPQLTEQQKTKLKAAVKDFEAIFVQYMLKSMQETENIDGEDKPGQGFGKDIMTGLFNMKLAQYMAKNSELGIGSMLYKEFTGENLDSQVPQTPPTDGNMSFQNLPASQAPFGALQKIRAYSSGSLLENVGKYSDIINEAAGAYNLQPNLIKAVIAAESAGKADSVSSKNAKGLMQLVDSTAKEMGVTNPMDPRENIMGGTKYLKSLLDEFSGNLPLALASYNAGPGAVQQYGGVPPYGETQNYIKRVMNYLNMFDGSEVSNDGR
jgi:soluble lytic murein transglycosylase-like protein